MRTPFTSIALLLIDSPAHVRNHADESDSTRLARAGMVREMDVLGRSAVKTEVYSSSGVTGAAVKLRLKAEVQGSLGG